MRAIVLGIVVSLSFIATANAEGQRKGTVNDLINLAGTDDQWKSLFIGAGRALEGVNIELQRQNRPRLYCQPGNLAITGDQYVRILASYVEKNPKTGTMDLNYFGFALLQATMDVFPCK